LLTRFSSCGGAAWRACDGRRRCPLVATRTGIQSVTAITEVYTFGQKVAAVAIEYGDVVDPRTLDRNTFTVSDSIYNFRFNPPEDLPKLADRTVTRVYTNDEPALGPWIRPKLTTVALPHYELGRKAVDVLFAQIGQRRDHTEPEAVVHRVAMPIRRRDSVAPPHAWCGRAPGSG
jgi:hypothetical protein